jgi:hypothetical protein
LLGPPRHNFTAALQFTFFPRSWGVSPDSRN